MDRPETPEARALGLDYGQARIGVAVSDELGWFAHPRDFIAAKPPQRALRLIQGLVRAEGIGHVLVGLPRNLDGTEGLSARRARQFADELSALLRMEVELVDERLSTVQAHARLRESGRDARSSRERVDSASAAILLQAWLDGRRR
ncbi:MAG TPA: Holliday junction resolvase RuvX [Polyangiaceae bacterium]|nr:Holliday junction resolvase RuvX [Polyangiaceae bacterium]